MNATVTTRAATVADAKDVARLAGQLGYPMDAATARERLASITGDRAVVVAEYDGRIVGWIELEVRANLIGGMAAEIAGLVVDAEARRCGAGRALVDVARAWARERGLAKLRVRSNAKREEAAAFYPAVGFTLEKMQRVFTSDQQRA